VFFLISIRKLRKILEEQFNLSNGRINIKRKKKMIIENTPNNCVKLKRRNVIKIEIIE